jgi:hypothetical protein
MLVRMWEKKGTLIHCWWEYKLESHYGNQYWCYLYNKQVSAMHHAELPQPPLGT